MYKWDHAVFISLCPAYFSQHNLPQVHPCCFAFQFLYPPPFPVSPRRLFSAHVCMHRHFCGSAFASGSLTFCSLSRGEHCFAESAFLLAVLKMILTGSQASWGPESAEQEGNKGHRTVEEEAANLKAEPMPLNRSGEESHHL